MQVRVKMEPRDLSRMLDRSGINEVRRRLKDPRLIRYMGLMTEFQLKKRIRGGEDSPTYFGTGKPFKELSKITKWIRKHILKVPEYPPLWATGKMIGGYFTTVKVGLLKNIALVGPRPDQALKAALNERGGKGTFMNIRNKKIQSVILPARPFLGWNRSDIEEITMFVVEQLKSGLKVQFSKVKIRFFNKGALPG